MLREAEVKVATGDAELPGTLALPDGCLGVVVFVHGSGSSRLSPRNRRVAADLQRAGLGTLLFDLLTDLEGAVDDRTRHLRFDIGLLARRVTGAVDWLGAQPTTACLPIGLFGASTGAAAALVAAARRPDAVAAVVSRGGRPDLAGEALAKVRCPTLLVVGSHDPEVLALNERALQELRGDARLAIVPGATHLFEEPGTLDEVVDQATAWFHRWLAPRGRAAATA